MTERSHLQLYVDESMEKLTELNNALLTLEDEGEDAEALDMSFRSAHTIKGNSKAMGFDEVGDLAHAVEDLLDAMRDGELAVTPETMDLAFAGLDEIEATMAEIADDGEVQRDPEPVMREIREGLEELQSEAAATDAAETATEDEPAASGGGDGTAASDSGDEPTASGSGDATDASEDESADAEAAEAPDAAVDGPQFCLALEIDSGPIPGADALLVLERIESESTVVATRPPRDAVESGEYDEGFDVIVTTEEPGVVADHVGGARCVTDVAVEDAPEDVDAWADAPVTADEAAAAEDVAAEEDAADDGERAVDGASTSGAGSVGDDGAVAEAAAGPGDGDADAASGFLARCAAGVRASMRATAAAVQALPGLAGGQSTSVASGSAAPASGDEASDDEAVPDEASVDGEATGEDEVAVDDEATGEDEVAVDEAATEEAVGTGAAAPSTAGDAESTGGDAASAVEAATSAVASDDGADSTAADGPSGDAGESPDAGGDETGGTADETGDDGDGPGGPPDDGSGGTADDASSDDGSGGTSSSGVSSVRIDVDRLDELYGIVEQLYTNRIRLRRIVEAAGVDEASEQLDALDKNTTQLQDAVMDMRLVPLSRVLSRFPRTVRDIARDQGKEVDLEIEGDDVEVDRVVLDEISDPLMHLVRNAVDHGLETPAEREAAGKDPEGTMAVRGRRERDQVVIEVEDDGRGLDADDLRAKAVEEGVHTREQVEAMPDEEVHELVFHPGFSTADEVTEVSGRGVGMDVVRQRVRELDGAVSIDSEPGEGTTVTLRLPVTVAIVEVLFVDVGEATYGIPIKEIDRISRDEGIQTVDGRRTIEYEDTIYPVICLNEFFGEPVPEDDVDRRLVRIHPDRRKVAVLCDAVHDHEEVVVKPLAGPVANTPGLSGTTVLGDGDVVPIVDVQSIGG